MSFLQELKRRNVVRVGIAYVVASWLILQLTEVLTELLDVSNDMGKIVIILLIVGFVPALIFAWAFELTPDGIKRDSEVSRAQSATRGTGRKLDFFIIAVLVVALGYFIFDEIQDQNAPATAAAITAQTGDAAADPSQAQTAGAGAAMLEPEPSIAVLPFADMSAAGDQAYFSDGIAEELLNLLVRVEGLKVASRTSSFAYKNTGQSINEIAGELKVGHILEGSVRKAENRIRITAQLIDADSDRHLWSETYDRELDDIFAIQDEIATAIVSALQEELGVLQEAQVEVNASTSNLDAYQSFLKARGLFNARDQLTESIRLFEQAVALDPQFVLAWEGLAAVYNVAPSWQIRDRDYGKLSLEAADKALSLDPSLSTAWAVKAQEMLNTRGDYVAAMAAYNQALRNDPRNTNALLWRSIQWFTLGFMDEAIADTERCLEFDPAYLNCARFLARYYLSADRPVESFELYLKNVEKGFTSLEYALVAQMVQNGDRLSAALAIWVWLGGDRSYPTATILDGLQYPQRDHAAGRKIFNNWMAQSGRDPVDSVGEYVILGDYAQAAANVTTTSYSNDWLWENYAAGFRRSPYFKPTVIKIGMPAFWRSHGFPPMCRPLGDDDFECDS